MKYLAIALLLGGCATKSDLSKLQQDIGTQAASLDETKYHLQIESCKSSALICGLATKNEAPCIDAFANCVSFSLEKFREKYGRDPSDLFPEPKRAR